MLTLLIAPVFARACSARSFQPIPVRPDFSVVVSHRDKPLTGVEVSVTPNPGASPFLTVSTDENGIVEVRDLPAGEYWLAASFRNIEAGRELIEVSPDTKKPRKQFDFHWADDSYEMRMVSGRLTGLVKGGAGHPLQDLIHPREVAHPGVAIALRNAFSDEEYRVVSDSEGAFVVSPLPPGTYILTIGGGAKSIAGRRRIRQRSSST